MVKKNMLSRLLELVGGYRDHAFDFSAANRAAQVSVTSADVPSLKSVLKWGVVILVVLAILVFVVDKYMFNGQISDLLVSLVGENSDSFTGCNSKKYPEDKFSQY